MQISVQDFRSDADHNYEDWLYHHHKVEQDLINSYPTIMSLWEPTVLLWEDRSYEDEYADSLVEGICAAAENVMMAVIEQKYGIGGENMVASIYRDKDYVKYANGSYRIASAEVLIQYTNNHPYLYRLNMYMPIEVYIDNQKLQEWLDELPEKITRTEVTDDVQL